MELLNPLSVHRAKDLFFEKKFEARCLATDQVGQCVYIRGPSGTDNVVKVGKSDPTNLSKMPSVGVIVEKETSTDCTVLVLGEMDETADAGDNLYVGVAGFLTTTPPIPMPGQRVLIQNMGKALDDGLVLVTPNRNMFGRSG